MVIYMYMFCLYISVVWFGNDIMYIRDDSDSIYNTLLLHGGADYTTSQHLVSVVNDGILTRSHGSLRVC